MLDFIDGTLQRLRAYAASFTNDFRRRDQARWIGVYLQGLLAAGERKNVETLARRVVSPSDSCLADAAQALQNFVNQSPWDEQKVWRRYRAQQGRRLAQGPGVFVVEDVGFPKKGQHSVGVQRQLWSAAGRKVNCQIAVSLSYVSGAGHLPLALRLYLPRGWLTDPHRLDAAGVPAEFRQHRSKGEIALDLLDQIRAEGYAGQTVVAGISYGSSREFRDGLRRRGLHALLGTSEDCQVYSDPAVAGGNSRLATVADVARRAASGYTWRPGANAIVNGRTAWLPVRPGPEWGDDRGAGPTLGLLIALKTDGSPAYALADVPPSIQGPEALRLWASRATVAEALRRMRDELGLDHFEGRSWRGFHHHACLVMLAYGFLLEEEAAADRPVAVAHAGR